MKRLVLFLALVSSISVWAQVSDDFSDGDFTANPAWTGNEDSFVIDGETGMLRSANTTANARFYLSTPNARATETQWEWYVNLQFNTSSANYVDVFLVSNKENLSVSAGMNGYFVRLGGTLDEICLYKRTNGVDVKIIDGVDGVLNKSNNILKIRVTRDENNLWTLDRDITGTGTNYFTEGTVTDGTFTSTTTFGVYIVQSTSSFFNKHFFTDFYVGEIIPDTEAPTVLSTVISGSNELTINFSEEMNLTTAIFAVQSLNAPAVTIAPDKKSVTLTFDSSFALRTVYTLSITGASDKAYNALEKTEYFFGLTEQPEVGDLIINEICFNNAEGSEKYVEIYNKSNKILNVGGVRITTRKADGTLTQTAYSIPANITMVPDSYLALCKTPSAVQTHYNTPEEANFAALSSFPTLNSTSATIVLADATLGNIFDELTYSSKWHSPLLTNVKGIALERINPNLPTQEASNWHSAASNVNYGTPGYRNSQYSTDTPSATGKKVWVEPENFTPDNDGIDDVTNIYFHTAESGYFVTVSLYDALGRKVRTLANNLFIAPEGFIRWDGTDDTGKVVNVGIYAVYAEIIRPDGKKEQFKFPCVVSAIKN